MTPAGNGSRVVLLPRFRLKRLAWLGSTVLLLPRFRLKKIGLAFKGSIDLASKK